MGRALAERLDLRYIDREMLRDAAEFLCAQDAEQRATPGQSSWWSRLGQTFALGGPDCGYVPPSSDAVYEGELFDIQKRLIAELVEDCSAVVVGRGAAQTLRGRPGVLSVFLHAPEAWRVDRAQQIYGLSGAEAARRMVQDSDRDRARFIKASAGIEWTDSRAYELAIDTAAIGLDAAVDLIVRAADALTRRSMFRRQ